MVLSDEKVEEKLARLGSRALRDLLQEFEPIAVPHAAGTEGDVSILGRGAFGVVRAMRRTRDGEAVAVKELCRSLLSKPANLRHLLTEVAVLKCLQHDSIIPVQEMVHTADRVYVVMKLGRGRDLHFVINERHPDTLTVGESRAVMLQLLRALDYIHRNGVVHRDVKPENILCDPERWVVQLIDFGVAKAIGGAPPQSFPPSGGQFPPSPPALATASATTNSPGGQMMGVTPGTFSKEYAAMEALLSLSEGCGKKWFTTRRNLPKLDVYSAGATMWVMLTGQFPPLGQLTDQLARDQQQWRARVSALWSNLAFPSHCRRLFVDEPAALPFVKRLLAVDASKRPTAQEALTDLFFNPTVRELPKRASISVGPCPGKKKSRGRMSSSSSAAADQSAETAPATPGSRETSFGDIAEAPSDLSSEQTDEPPPRKYTGAPGEFSGFMRPIHEQEDSDNEAEPTPDVPDVSPRQAVRPPEQTPTGP